MRSSLNFLRAVSSMSEQNVLSGRVETFNFSVQAYDGEVLPSAVFRLVLNVSYGASVGKLQKGYYIKLNDLIYFVSQKTIQVDTTEQATKVFAFLQKTQIPFTVTLKCEKTCSGYQYVRLNDVVSDTFYTLKQFQVFRGMWREIEGVLHQTKNSEIARFSGGKLDWLLELMLEKKLSFTQPSVISASLFTTQGHLQVLKLAYDDVFAIPYYLYMKRREVKIFNHSLQGDLVVIPLGLEQKIIKVLSMETQVTSDDHEPISLPQGEYLLFHPIPRLVDAVD